MKSSYTRLIGQVIKRYRTMAGLSQMRLGEMIGVSYQQIQKYESGRSTMSLERLIEIADALKIPVTKFLPPRVEQVSEEEIPYSELSEEEKRLIELFRQIKSREMRKALFKILENIVGRE